MEKVTDSVISVHSRCLTQAELRDRLSQFGQILNIYPWVSGSSRTHYFIEFDSPEAANRARVDTRDMNVQFLSRNPDMVKRFKDIVASSTMRQQWQRQLATKRTFGEMQNCTSSPGNNDSYSGPVVRRRLSKEGSSQCHTTPSFLHQPALPIPLPSYQEKPNLPNGNELPGFSNAYAAAAFNPFAPPLNHSIVPKAGKPQPPVVPYMHCFSSNDPLSPAANMHAPSEYDPSFPLLLLPAKSETTSMSHDKGGFMNNLPSSRELDSTNDTAKMIANLRRAAASLGEWMTAAAQYRRDGRHEAALELANALVDEMERRKIKKSDIKPVWLLIAQCHYSIALGSKRSDLSQDQEKKLFLDAIDYLYKTYGVDDAKVLSIATATAARTESREQPRSYPLQPLTQAAQPQTSDLTTDSPKRPLLPVASIGKENRDTIDIHKQLRVLKSAHEGSITYLRSVQRDKQAAENALAAERQNGKELVSRVRDLEEQLRHLREETADLHSRIRRESEARHSTEARLARETQASREREEASKAETTKLLLLKLSRTLGKVAENPLSMRELTKSTAGCKEEQQEFLQL